MIKMLCICAVLFTGAMGQSRPLIMEHADSLSVDRSRGSLLLFGNVKFKHDSIRFTTGSANWSKSRDVVVCENGFVFMHPQGSLKANSGRYQRKEQIAEAFGSVVSRDSSGEAAFFGERMLYDRGKRFLDLTSTPLVQRYFKDTVKKKVDTLSIVARRITYDSDKQLANAMGNVTITRGKMVVTCDTGLFDRKGNTLTLVGKPTCTLDRNRLTGDSMHLVLNNESLKSVRVVRNALGVQQEQVKKSPMRHTQVQGDTLFAAFENDQLQEMHVSIKAEGRFWEEDLSQYVNKMNGDQLSIQFKEGQMDLARVLGQAKSSYWNVNDKRKVAGRNDAMGDSIYVTFDSSKVSRLRITGKKATGVYVDLEKQVKK